MNLVPQSYSILPTSWPYLVTTPQLTHWFNPILRLATLPTLRLFSQLSRLCTSAKGSSKRVFRDTYRKSSTGYLPLPTSPLFFRKRAHSMKVPPATLTHPTPLNPWVLWTFAVLKSKTSHQLVGNFPRRIVRGESTSSLLRSTLGFFRKKRRARRRWSTPTLETTLSYPLTLFRVYLNRKLSDSHFIDKSLRIVLDNLVQLKRVKGTFLRSKSTIRFRPYQFLDLDLPQRAFEPLPYALYTSMVPRFFYSQLELHGVVTEQSQLSTPGQLIPSINRVDTPQSRQSTQFAFAKLPRRLRARLRWARFEVFLNDRFRRKQGSTRVAQANYHQHLLNFNPTRMLSSALRVPQGNPLKPSLRVRQSRLLKVIGFSISRWLPFFSLSDRRLPPHYPSVNPPRKVISMALLRQFVNSIRYAWATTDHIPRPHYAQLAASKLFSPYPPNSLKLAIRHALYGPSWTNYLATGLRPIPKRTLPLKTSWGFDINGPRSFNFNRKKAQSKVQLPLYESNGLVFTDSPITFESFRAMQRSDCSQPTSLDFSLDFLLQQPFAKLLLPTRVSTTFAPFTTLPLVERVQPSIPLKGLASITPSHSHLFQRSYLFFVNLIVRPTHPSLDLLVSSPYADPVFSFNVFPDSNLIKVSVFRRLNRQKSLYEARKDLFTSFSLPHMYNPHLVRREERRLDLHPQPSVSSVSAPIHTLLYSSTSPYRRPWTLRKSLRQVLKVQRVRFKPGYGRIWRRGRSSIREILNIPSRYQYRLTPKLQTCYTQNRQILKPYSSLSLDYLLMSSHLIPDFWVLDSLLDSQSIFLNGFLTQNPRVRVFINDFIQLTINLKFFITLKWLRNWSSLRQKRVTRVFYSKYRPSGTDKGFKFARPLPNWFFDLRFSYRSIPQILEVDFFTLSIFVIHDKLSSDPTEPVRANLYDASVLNMYNWKYIT